MARATALRRVLFTQDEDHLAIASRWLELARPFAGLIYAHQMSLALGQAIRDLEILCKTSTPEELWNTVQFLPL